VLGVDVDATTVVVVVIVVVGATVVAGAAVVADVVVGAAVVGAAGAAVVGAAVAGTTVAGAAVVCSAVVGAAVVGAWVANDVLAGVADDVGGVLSLVGGTTDEIVGRGPSGSIACSAESKRAIVLDGNGSSSLADLWPSTSRFSVEASASGADSASATSAEAVDGATGPNEATTPTKPAVLAAPTLTRTRRSPVDRVRTDTSVRPAGRFATKL
jgi:hypothetical protein